MQVAQRDQPRRRDLSRRDVGGPRVAGGEARAGLALGAQPEGFAAQGEGGCDGLEVVEA